MHLERLNPACHPTWTTNESSNNVSNIKYLSVSSVLKISSMVCNALIGCTHQLPTARNSVLCLSVGNVRRNQIVSVRYHRTIHTIFIIPGIYHALRTQAACANLSWKLPNNLGKDARFSLIDSSDAKHAIQSHIPTSNGQQAFLLLMLRIASTYQIKGKNIIYEQ